MGDEKVKADALQVIGMFSVLPRLVVFDLDYTLWPFYCECRSKREMPSLKCISRKLSLKSMFAAQEIYSSWSHKTEHFQRIHLRTGVPFSSMLFFDDEDRNIHAVSKMGVTSILVGNGVNLGEFRKGLVKFSENFDATENK
ncbi:hypothetical protein MLD38_022938 [Melastoma candidum]|uniref:Uncharacterized protein n=1 Tax=Melastoma candidum TaxID=119954 RepID=A0ACB9QL37_9MYRT|nr:hypothetical protein MLD38_022938 [Melastoma candidum]